MSGSIPSTTSNGSSKRTILRRLRRRKVRCIPRPAAPTQELRVQESRPHDPQHDHRPPWSQHFCCMISATADYVNRYPVATKRVLQGHSQGRRPLRVGSGVVAQQMVDRGFVPATTTRCKRLNDIRYDRWRDYDAEASMRFYALRMHETGMIKSSPQEIIAERDGLALPRRAEARAEDIGNRHHGRFPCIPYTLDGSADGGSCVG